MSFADVTLNLSPASSSLDARRACSVARGVASATSIYVVKCNNAELWDAAGRKYIDFAAGIAVVNTGHRHPKVIEAVKAQMDCFTHSAFQVAPYESYIALAERLNVIAPIAGVAKSVFFTTGAEATENAVKIARVATGRSGVIAFAGGFHGRTLLASAMTGKVAPYKRGFGPLPGEVFHIPFPTYRGSSVAESLRSIELLFATDIEPERVAAIIIEPVQGEGGFHVAPTELLVALRSICDQHGIVLIADEVQSGFARTGRMFGIEHSGVKPDLITVAKALAGGFPLSGVVGKAELMDAVQPGGLGGTFGGSPLGCVAALAVLDVIAEESLIERANAIGHRLRSAFEDFSHRNDLMPIAGVRGLGAMIAFDLIADDRLNIDPARTKQVCGRALEQGLILLSCGTQTETIRVLPPLTISDFLLDEGIRKIEQALRIDT